MLFQSTLPVRGATVGGRQYLHFAAISIHAPREGSDRIAWCIMDSGLTFQSTLPVRGATVALSYCNLTDRISIHAPREGSDSVADVAVTGDGISIHAPREGSDQRG